MNKLNIKNLCKRFVNQIKRSIRPSLYKMSEEIIGDVNSLFNLPDEQQICVNIISGASGCFIVEGKKYYLQIFKSNSREEHYEKIKYALLYNNSKSNVKSSRIHNKIMMSLPEQLKNITSRKKIYLYYCPPDQKGQRRLRCRKETDLLGRTREIWLSDIAFIIR